MGYLLHIIMPAVHYNVCVTQATKVCKHTHSVQQGGLPEPQLIRFSTSLSDKRLGGTLVLQA